jgi:hypothetical protein
MSRRVYTLRALGGLTELHKMVVNADHSSGKEGVERTGFSFGHDRCCILASQRKSESLDGQDREMRPIAADCGEVRSLRTQSKIYVFPPLLFDFYGHSTSIGLGTKRQR